MATDEVQPSMEISYKSAKPKIRHTKLALLAVILGAAALAMSWICIAGINTRKPWLRDLNNTIHTTYFITLWLALVVAAVAMVQLIIISMNAGENPERKVKGILATLLGIAMAVPSYLILM